MIANILGKAATAISCPHCTDMWVTHDNLANSLGLENTVSHGSQQAIDGK